MRKELFIISFITFFSILSCTSEDDLDKTKTEWKCGFHKGKQLWTGPKGGCYYKNNNGNKTYVDRVNCNC